MFNSFSLPVLLLTFAAAAAAVWVAGVHLSRATDVLSKRWGLGEALGGLILLALVTNLPEIAIVTSGALRHDVGLAVGNILGGISMQTVVLVLLDIFGVGAGAALTFRAASLTLALEGALVVAVLTVVIMGSQLPASLIFARVTPAGFLIALLWLVGLWLLSKARTDLPWQEKNRGSSVQSAAPQRSKTKRKRHPKAHKIGTAHAMAIFGVGALVTLICGVVLASSSEAIAKHIGMSGVLFGATVLAAATSLPELSTGLASVKMGDYQLAVSDIFGGNAFLPVLFLLATLLSGQAVLPQAHKSDIYLAALGILLTCVYITGLIFRSRRQVARMGLDSLTVIVLYVVGMLGLFALSRS